MSSANPNQVAIGGFVYGLVKRRDTGLRLLPVQARSLRMPTLFRRALSTS